MLARARVERSHSGVSARNGRARSGSAMPSRTIRTACAGNDLARLASTCSLMIITSSGTPAPYRPTGRKITDNHGTRSG
ncbi:hypothetical protein GCM10010171_59910 [Actinokineospora fastidiosa]|uniref:Uncharacterized protein n=1 Tax=Actinokineospora fastidiosa TaxID=1816 RepID=A0A918GRX4_9PSEU|nr:hypothetical protein GCM10010171_59910 [Actinokineospora fastidiosa]